MNIIIKHSIQFFLFIFFLNCTFSCAQSTSEDYFDLAIKKLDANDQSGSKKDIDKSIELKPDNPDPYYTRAFFKLSDGDTMGALNDYNKAIILNSFFPQAYYNRGILR